MSAKLFTIGVAIFLAVAFTMFLFIDSFNGELNEATGLIVSQESFPTYLENHPAIESMPKSSSIGVIIGENNYEIEGRSVRPIAEHSEEDIKIILPENYEKIIGEVGLCEAVRKVNKDNEFKVELYSNKAFLLLKYRKLLKYGKCLQ
ncbi:hypothetical protein FJZ21_03095 [Candidatus Pacearchaeota archaeon]|nr:hypothetical protein [Candidatus Pacearchaeota archaeon]